jgi:purine-nucleoside phosphorylase
VQGHNGNLIFGKLNNLPVVCMQGRFHSYEGYSQALCAMPIKIFKLLGCKLVVLTNASGGLNESYRVGDFMLIKDHISMPLISLNNPLIGPNDERFGPRFVATNNIYSKPLRDLFKQAAAELNLQIHEGVYGNVGGPTYETVSDGLFCKLMGMDVVGRQ